MHKENGDIHEVNGDNRQLRAIETEIAKPGCFHQVCPIEISQPQSSHEQSHDGRVCRHICCLIHSAENMRRRSFSPVCHSIKTAGTSHHQSVQSPNTGNDNEYKQQCAANIGKYRRESDFRTGFTACHDDFIFYSPCQTYIVQGIYQYNENRAEHQRSGQVLFGIFQFRVNAGGTNPTLISETSTYHCRKQRISADFHNGAAGKILYHNAVFQSINGANHCHQSQWNQFCHSGGYLKFPCKFRRNGIDGKTADEVQTSKVHCLRTSNIPSQQDCCIPRCYPCHHGSHGRKINDSHKPSEIVAILSAYHYFRIVHNAADFFVACCHNSEVIGADNHDQST